MTIFNPSPTQNTFFFTDGNKASVREWVCLGEVLKWSAAPRPCWGLLEGRQHGKIGPPGPARPDSVAGRAGPGRTDEIESPT